MEPEGIKELSCVHRHVVPGKPDVRSLPRCDRLDGSGLHIVPCLSISAGGVFNDVHEVLITDGVRTGVYVPATDRKVVTQRQDPVTGEWVEQALEPEKLNLSIPPDNDPTL